MSRDAKQHWTSLAKKLLLNRTIVNIEWVGVKEAEEVHGWDNRPIKLILDDGTYILPQCDDEGNDAGALLYINPKETVMSRGERFIKSEVLPVF